MSLQVGIVGLPNAGKSTLFTALTSQAVPAENYPFCTIDPNVGVVAVPDGRLEKLAAVSRSAKVIPTTIEFVDIAGLVRGASRGEGLGNRFLSHIREVDAIVLVLRSFTDPNVTHVHGQVDPAADREVLELELSLADLAAVERALEQTKLKLKAGPTPDLTQQLETLERLTATLRDGRAARTVELNEAAVPFVRQLQLLTAKPQLIVYNADEGAASPSDGLALCAKVEAELAQLERGERHEYLNALGLSATGLERLITAAYAELDLVTFFTSGEKETRAWTVRRGTLAPQAAGVIHSDFEAAFIRAEVIGVEDFLSHHGEAGARTAGKLRIEGKTYAIQDGDVCHFRVGV